MKRIFLDTNAYATFKQGKSELVELLGYADQIDMSVIVLGELIAGFSAGTKYNKNMSELNEFLNTARVKILPIDETTTSFYAKIYINLKEKGKPIPTNDLWIAAAALQHGCMLCSYDKHFQMIDNLVIVRTLDELLF